MLFKISKDIFLFKTIKGRNDQVYMVGHDAPGIQYQAFMLLTITKAIDKDIFVHASC